MEEKIGETPMNSVVSATTSKVYGSPARISRRDAFFNAAEDLIAAAHDDVEAGRFDLAMENAYRAALRIAGAVNAGSEVLRKRKRLPTSAWEKLALCGPEAKEWAARFSAYSRLRGRVASGLELRPDPAVVLNLLGDAEEFLYASHPGKAPLAAA